ncbi:MAG: single-stranded-DNA-specific exonuclease RecJ, partial [Endomicrobium sp.]|nr:single-stranded-DNA-specific exonuclease RecJ [Endomicrobium sp.]
MTDTKKEWKIVKEDVKKVSDVAYSLMLDQKIAKVLVGRGIDTVEKARQFISGGIENLHNPFLFSDMQKAVNRIRMALDLHESILVYGDRDVDGITAINVVVNTIKLLGGKVQWYVPADEGYGIHKDILLKYAAGGNVKILITVDCGISALEEVAYAKKMLGMHVIITDHHEPPYEGIPKADAVINPKVYNSNYPFKSIAGCVVSLKLMHALMLTFCKEYDKEIALCYGIKNNDDFSGSYICLKNGLETKKADFRSVQEIKGGLKEMFKIYTNGTDIRDVLIQNNTFLKDKIIVIKNENPANNITDLGEAYKIRQYNDDIIKNFFENNLDLCALGTIADSMPLIDENRIIVKKGLKIIENNPHARPGLGLLIDDMSISQDVQNITAKMISWNVTPVLNSSGRMARGTLSAQLLMTKDAFQAKDLYSDIVKLNKDRRWLQSANIEQFKQLLKEQCNLENDKVLIIKALNLEHGVTGIIASQMVKTYFKPAFLFISDGQEATGAARSVDGFDVVAALESVKDILVKYGGHNQAAGFTLEDSKIEEFIKRISEYVDRNLIEKTSGNTMLIESELKISDITVDFHKHVEIMEPFGIGNMRPIFYIKGVVPTEISVFGNRGEHLKFKISSKGSRNVRAVFWNKAKLANT